MEESLFNLMAVSFFMLLLCGIYERVRHSLQTEMKYGEASLLRINQTFTGVSILATTGSIGRLVQCVSFIFVRPTAGDGFNEPRSCSRNAVNSVKKLEFDNFMKNSIVNFVLFIDLPAELSIRLRRKSSENSFQARRVFSEPPCTD